MADDSLARIGEAFFAAEKAEDLYNWTVDGVHVWPVFRSRILKFMTRNEKRAQMETPDDDAPASAAVAAPSAPAVPERHYRGRSPESLLWAAARGKAAAPQADEPDFRSLGDRTTVVVPFATRDAAGIDKFSQPVIDHFGDRALVIGVGLWDKGTAFPTIEALQEFFWKKYGLWARIKTRLVVTKDVHRKYDRVRRILEESGASTAPYDRFPRWLYARFLAERIGYRTILKAMPKVSTIYMVNAARMSFIAAAHDCGIRVVEIQSGVFSKYSLQFSWPGSPRVEYIPDEIWTWGEYWTVGIERASQQTVRIMGATDEFESIRSASIPRVPGQTLFLSQPTIAADLLSEALEFAVKCPERSVIFKLHPRNSVDEISAQIEEFGQTPANFSVSHTEQSSLEMISASELAVGVFSTALIEAASLGAKVAIMTLPGWEHLEPLIVGGHAHAFATVDDLIAGIPNIPIAENGEFFYGHTVRWDELLGDPTAERR